MSAPVPRPGILSIAPYVPGEAHAAQASRQIRLASNEGALGPSPKAVAAYQAAAGEIHRYPDGGSVALREALGQTWNLDPARIVCGTGSDELISLLVRAYAGPGDEVLYSAHGFLMYPLAAQSVGATPVAAPESRLTADVDALLARVSDRTRVVFLANPNNPTGTVLSTAEVVRLHAGLPERVVLALDSAYAEYLTDSAYSAGAEMVEAHANVVMLRTFSKMYAMGGLRLGWGYCPAGIADILNRIRGVFNINSAAQAAALAALADADFIAASRQHNETWREWFTTTVRQLGLTVHPSVTNFVLVSFAGQSGDAGNAETARLFLKERGILVRQMGVYGLPDCLRVTIGTGEEMQSVVAALKDFLAR